MVLTARGQGVMAQNRHVYSHEISHMRLDGPLAQQLLSKSRGMSRSIHGLTQLRTGPPKGGSSALDILGGNSHG